MKVIILIDGEIGHSIHTPCGQINWEEEILTSLELSSGSSELDRISSGSFDVDKSYLVLPFQGKELDGLVGSHQVECRRTCKIVKL